MKIKDNYFLKSSGTMKTEIAEQLVQCDELCTTVMEIVAKIE